MPAEDFRDRVGTRDEHEFDVVGIVRTQLAQRVDGVGVAAALDLHRAHVESGIALGREAAHGKPVVRGRDIAVALEDGAAGGNEHHRIEPVRLAHLLGAGQMPDVDGVEGAAHDSQPGRRTVRPQVVESLAHDGRTARGHLTRKRDRLGSARSRSAGQRRAHARFTCQRFLPHALGSHLAVASQHVLVRGQPVGREGAAHVQLLRGDADLGAEAEHAAVREGRRSVRVDRRRVDLV